MDSDIALDVRSVASYANELNASAMKPMGAALHSSPTDLAAGVGGGPGVRVHGPWGLAAELRASRRYGRYLRVDKGGQLHIDKAALATAARMDGKWVLITNDDTLSIEDVAQGYQGLMVIERCFRTLKTTQIKLRPMYHWLPRRIETHVKLCVLALLLERYAEVQLGRPWAWIKHELDTLQVTEFRSDAHRFFRRNTVTPEVADMLKKLQISVPKVILGVRPLPPEA